MTKHAYMIIAHNQFELLEILIKMLDDERNDIFIHIDKKIEDFDFDYFSSITKYSKVHFSKRVLITWGDSSQIQSELSLLKCALNNEDKENPYSYFHLISGVDLPIKTNDEMHGFFELNQGKEFVHFSNEKENEGVSTRIKYYHIFRKKRNLFNKILAQIALKFQKLFRVNRLKNMDITVKKGTNWFSITHDLAQYVVSKENEIEKMFSYSYCSDEVFLQTLVFNSKFWNNVYIADFTDNQLACARLIDWNRGKPYIFKSCDFDEIISSPAMFARKFDLNTDKEIIYKIRDYIGEKANG